MEEIGFRDDLKTSTSKIIPPYATFSPLAILSRSALLLYGQVVAMLLSEAVKTIPCTAHVDILTPHAREKNAGSGDPNLQIFGADILNNIKT